MGRITHKEKSSALRIATTFYSLQSIDVCHAKTTTCRRWTTKRASMPVLYLKVPQRK